MSKQRLGRRLQRVVCICKTPTAGQNHFAVTATLDHSLQYSELGSGLQRDHELTSYALWEEHFQQPKKSFGTSLSRLVTLSGMLGLPARSGLSIEQRIQLFDISYLHFNSLKRHSRSSQGLIKSSHGIGFHPLLEHA